MTEDQLLSDPAADEGNGTQFVTQTPSVPEPVPAAVPKPTGLKPTRTPISVLAKQYTREQKPKYECVQPENINSGFEAVVGMILNFELSG